MGPLAQFLLALTNLVRSGIIRKLPDAIKAAEREFGKVTPLLKKQIERIFEQAKKPVVGKPGKKEGAVIPMVKEGAKKAEGIETLDDKGLTDSPLDDLKRIIEESGGTAKTRDEILRDEMLKDTDPPELDSKENIMGAIDKLKNPRRPGGPLDPAMGVTRTLARRILEKRNIEIGKRDPIDVFDEIFGEIIVDVKDLAEDIIEAEQMGRNLKPMDDLLEIEGFFDMEIPKDPRRGVPVEETIKRLEKDLREKEILEDFDPTDRTENATGGLTRTSYAMGGGRDTGTIGEMKSKLGVLSNKVRRTSKRLEERGEPAFLEMGRGPVLPSDEDPINPFGPKPTGPVLPDKSMMADLGDEFISPEYEEEFRKFLMMLQESEREQSLDNIMEMFKKYMLSKEPKVMEAATGGLAKIINL